MLGTNEYADNLFLRLSPYSPRPNRDALEDFCSEALVWCLRQSLTFRQKFLKLSGLKFLRHVGADDIHSQQSFKDEDQDAEGIEGDIRGRFDIVFAKDSSFYVALESKVQASIDPRQISNYLRRLDSVKQLYPQGRCALLTLTSLGHESLGTQIVKDIPVKQIRWRDVHRQLHATSTAKPNTSAKESDMLLEMLGRFGEFLRVKGLADLSIPRVSSEALRQFIELRKGMEDILTSLKTSEHFKSQFAGKRIKFERQKGDAYLGIYGSPEPSSFYMGFEFRDTAEPKLSLYLERSLKGKRPDVEVPRELKKNHRRDEKFARGQTWFVFAQPVDRQFNGNAEAIKQWFYETSKLVFEMEKK